MRFVAVPNVTIPKPNNQKNLNINVSDKYTRNNITKILHINHSYKHNNAQTKSSLTLDVLDQQTENLPLKLTLF